MRTVCHTWEPSEQNIGWSLGLWALMWLMVGGLSSCIAIALTSLEQIGTLLLMVLQLMLLLLFLEAHSASLGGTT